MPFLRDSKARCPCCGDKFTPNRSRVLCDADAQAVAKIRRMKPRAQQALRDEMDLAEARWLFATDARYLLRLEQVPLSESPT